ncbi:MAG: hypothetical protein FWG34_07315 [Oscillospiraceae bacterium]|nr:hypothetical protein [Oscillospiraceae bacterium]
MKKKIGRLFSIFLALAFVFGLCGCNLGNKYFMELKGAYSYDGDKFVLKKYQSEITWEASEILSYSPENKKTTPIEYELLEIRIPKRNYATGEITDYVINMAYALHDGKLIFTEIPYLYAPHDYFIFGDFQDSVIVKIDDENAFLVNLNEASAKKLFDESNFENYFEKNASNKLIYAKLIDISPDGRYLLYLSNRDYIKGNAPKSVDIYFYDSQEKTEAKIMNFDNKELLGWEKGNSANFLFRESGTSASDGKKIYSDIIRYAIPQSKEDIFFSFDLECKNYEMISGQYAYTVEKTEKETLINIFDIYSGEKLSVSAKNYSLIWHVELSESKEYVAFFGSYINLDGMAIAEIITVNAETNKMVPQYEQGQGNYFIDSFEWLPDNVLVMNFVNTVRIYQDLCRFYEIDH